MHLTHYKLPCKTLMLQLLDERASKGTFCLLSAFSVKLGSSWNALYLERRQAMAFYKYV